MAAHASAVHAGGRGWHIQRNPRQLAGRRCQGRRYDVWRPGKGRHQACELAMRLIQAPCDA